MQFSGKLEGFACIYSTNEVTVRFRCAKSDRFAWIVLLYVVNIDLVIFRYHHRPLVIDMTTNVYFICVFFALFDKLALCYEVFVIKKISHRKISGFVQTLQFADWSGMTNSRNKFIQPFGSFDHFLCRYHQNKNNHGVPRL